MNAILRWLFAVVATAASVPGFTETSPVFAPSGPWAVKGDDGRCLLSRSFSDGSDAIDVQIEAWPTFQNLEMSISDPHRTGKYVVDNSDLRFADSQPPIFNRSIESFDSTDGAHRIHHGSLGRPELARIAADGAVTLAPEAAHYITIQMPRLAGAAALLKQCEDALFATAGLPVGALAAMKTMPAELGIDYAKPPVAVTRAGNGDLEDVGFAGIIVSPAGIPTRCNILHRAKSDLLNAALCGGMKSKFDPARDASGHPVLGIAFVVKRWNRFMRRRMPDAHSYRY